MRRRCGYRPAPMCPPFVTGAAPRRRELRNLVSTGGLFVFFDMVLGVFALGALKCAPLVILFVGIAAAYDISRAVPKPRGEEAISRQVQIIRGASTGGGCLR